MLEVELKSNDLKEYVYIKLNKNKKDPLYDTDLEKITEVHLNKLDLVDEPTDVTIYDLVFFKNLETCYLSNMKISEQELDVLNSVNTIKALQVNSCEFDGKADLKLPNLERIYFVDCDNIVANRMNSIKSLQDIHIVNCGNVDLNGISKLQNASKVYLQDMNLDNVDEVVDMPNIKYLNLNGSNVNRLDKVYAHKEIELEKLEENLPLDGRFGRM